MDEKKSVDEKFLAVRKKISTCDDAMLAAVDLLLAVKSGANLANSNLDQEKFGHVIDDLIDQGKIDHVVDDLLSALRSTLDLGSTIFDLAYGKE